MRISVIFNNFGPYHIARLFAVAQLSDMMAIEVVARSSEYVWSTAKDVPFTRKTLFASEHSPDFSSREYHVRLRRELSAFRPDVVAIPGWYGLDAFEAMDWAREQRVPLVLMSESQREDFKRSSLKEWLKARYLRNVQAALVGGSAHREYLERLGMDPTSIWNGYDVVDNSFFISRSDSVRVTAGDLKEQHNLPEHFFLASSRFIAKKNLLTLIRAYAVYFHEAERKHPGSSWALLLLGDGVLRNSLEAEVDSLTVTGKVRMPGFQKYEDLPVYYGLADAFVLPSVTEQWGLVVNEAMASGLPVLVSKSMRMRTGPSGRRYQWLYVQSIRRDQSSQCDA